MCFLIFKFSNSQICLKFGVKNILISGLVFTTRVSLEVLGKIYEKLSPLCSSCGLIYINNRNIKGAHLFQDHLHLLRSGKKVLCNNFMSYLNSARNFDFNFILTKFLIFKFFNKILILCHINNARKCILGGLKAILDV